MCYMGDVSLQPPCPEDALRHESIIFLHDPKHPELSEKQGTQCLGLGNQCGYVFTEGNQLWKIVGIGNLLYAQTLNEVGMANQVYIVACRQHYILHCRS